MYKSSTRAPARRAIAVGLAVLVAGVALVTRPVTGFAVPPTTFTYTGTAGGGLWSTPGNWSPAGPPTTGSNLVFPAVATTKLMTDDLGAVGASTGFAGISFSDTGYSVIQAGGATRSIALTGDVTDSSTTGNNMIAVPVAFSNALTTITANGAAAHNLYFSATNTDSTTTGFHFVGPGVVVMQAPNTFTHAIAIDGPSNAEVYAQNLLGLGSGAVTVGAGGQLSFGGTTGNFASPVILNGAGPGGTGALETHAFDDITLTGGLSINTASTIAAPASSTLNINSVFSGGGNLAIIGTGGVVTIGGSTLNAFSGSIKVDNAELQLNHSTSPAFTSSTVSVGTLPGLDQATLTFQAPNQFPANATTLVVNPVGTATAFVNLHGSTHETVNDLVLTGSTIDTAAGTDLVVGGAIASAPSSMTSTIGGDVAGGGTVDFTSGPHNIAVPSGTTPGGIDLEINSHINAAGVLTKTLGGLVNLSGTVAAPAGIVAAAGTLENLASSGTTPFSANAAILGGTGVNGATSVTNAGTFAAADRSESPTALGVASLILDGTSTFRSVINGTAAGVDTGYGQVTTAGAINLGGSSLDVTLQYTPAIGDQFTIINNTGAGAVTGIFAGLAEAGTFVVAGTGGQSTMRVSYTGGAGHSVVLTVVAPPSEGATAGFVRELYDDLLNRTADTAGLAYWTGQLDSGARTRDQVIRTFLGSPESRETFATINLYGRYLHRDPDSAGLAWAVQQLGSGVSEERLIAMVLSSSEYLSRSDGDGSAGTRIQHFYDDLLGRDASTGDVSYWLSTGWSASQIATYMIHSAEGRAAFVAECYDHFLDRTADSAGVQFYADAMAAGAPRQEVDIALMMSGEYASVPPG